MQGLQWKPLGPPQPVLDLLSLRMGALQVAEVAQNAFCGRRIIPGKGLSFSFDLISNKILLLLLKFHIKVILF
jgi:hypothetical protein